jgi:hypothetical protein
VPKKMRGLGHVCKVAGKLAYAYRSGEWVSEVDIFIAGARNMDKSAPLRRAFQRQGLLD